jgi:probable HAF family extracellular repeat protein
MNYTYTSASVAELAQINTLLAPGVPPPPPAAGATADQILVTNLVSPNGLVSAGLMYPGIGQQTTFDWISLDGKTYTTLPASLGVPAIYNVADTGEVVGNAYVNGVGFAFSYLNGVTTVLRPPGATGDDIINPQGVNDSGEVVGMFNTTGFIGGTHAFIYQHGTYTQIDYPGGTDTALYRVSNGGEVFGATTINGVRLGFTATPDTITPTPKMTLDPKTAFIHTASGKTDELSAFDGKVYSDATQTFAELAGVSATSYALKNDMLSLFNGNKLVDQMHLNSNSMSGVSIEHNALGVVLATSGHDVGQPGGIGTMLTLHG